MYKMMIDEVDEEDEEDEETLLLSGDEHLIRDDLALCGLKGFYQLDLRSFEAFGYLHMSTIVCLMARKGSLDF